MNFLGTTLLVLILIVLGFLIAGFIIYNMIKKRVKDVMPDFNVDNLSTLAQTNKNEIENSPKSINGMEPVLRPRIEKDFPDMSLEDLKSQNKDEIFAYFSAIENLDISHFKNYPNVNNQVQKEISENEIYKKKFSNLIMHKQAVSDYRILNNVQTIVFQMAIEYKLTDKNNTSPTKTQNRIETQWIFLPNEDNFDIDNSKAFNCPNCGAAVSDLTNRVCTYCSSAVEINFSKSWKLNSILEK